MESSLEVESLKQEMAGMEERDQVLHVDLAGRDPDDGFTGVPYIKGAMFLRTVEKAVGREAFDAFLRAYFDEFAFRSVTTGQFADYLAAELLSEHEQTTRTIRVAEWLREPGLPEQRHEPVSAALETADASARDWSGGSVAAAQLETSAWSTQHWLRFLRSMPAKLGSARLAELDSAFGLTEAGNAEILCEWLTLAVRNGYAPADAALERFLTTVGRRKFLRPLYEELAKTEAGLARAAAIYTKARPGYHPMVLQGLDRIVGRSEP